VGKVTRSFPSLVGGKAGALCTLQGRNTFTIHHPVFHMAAPNVPESAAALVGARPSEDEEFATAFYNRIPAYKLSETIPAGWGVDEPARLPLNCGKFIEVYRKHDAFAVIPLRIRWALALTVAIRSRLLAKNPLRTDVPEALLSTNIVWVFYRLPHDANAQRQHANPAGYAGCSAHTCCRYLSPERAAFHGLRPDQVAQPGPRPAASALAAGTRIRTPPAPLGPGGAVALDRDGTAIAASACRLSLAHSFKTTCHLFPTLRGLVVIHV
jgi:hypothetical protein